MEKKHFSGRTKLYIAVAFVGLCLILISSFISPKAKNDSTAADYYSEFLDI